MDSFEADHVITGPLTEEMIVRVMELLEKNKKITFNMTRLDFRRTQGHMKRIRNEGFLTGLISGLLAGYFIGLNSGYYIYNN